MSVNFQWMGALAVVVSYWWLFSQYLGTSKVKNDKAVFQKLSLCGETALNDDNLH